MSTDVSVIIPVFNAEKYLAEAIESVLEQVPEPLEVILVDDGSTDQSMKIAQHFGDRIRIFKQENKGAGVARNYGVHLAKGKYLAFIDADDLWAKDKMNLQLNFLEGNPTIDMVFGLVEQFISPELGDDHKNKLKEELKKIPGYIAGAMLIRKDDFLKVGLFNEKLELGEYIDWFSRAKDQGLSYHVLDEVMLRRRIHTSNMGIYKRKHVKDYTSLLRAAIERKRQQK